jgi:hypothetical protein
MGPQINEGDEKRPPPMLLVRCRRYNPILILQVRLCADPDYRLSGTKRTEGCELAVAPFLKGFVHLIICSSVRSWEGNTLLLKFLA